MNIQQMTRNVLEQFPYDPTKDQLQLIHELVSFVQLRDHASMFIMKGYAGTGKTTLVSSFVRMLGKIAQKPVLLAPTGRAAKVLAAYAGERAFTIHKKIYRIQEGVDGNIEIALQPNKYKNTFFIVDEASMISYSKEPEPTSIFGNINLLDDLVRYVYSASNCRLILIGDSAQLPPVFFSESPALNPEWMSKRFHLRTFCFEMREVVRQSSESGILFNATILRNMLLENKTEFPAFLTGPFNDFTRLNHEETGEQIMQSFDHRELQNSLIICRSNKRASLFNQNIRKRVLFMEDEINSGDIMMVVRNNYFWLPDNAEPGFIANGDMIKINRIRRQENLYNFRFADIQAEMTDYPEEPDLEARILLDILDSEKASLPNSDSKALFDAVSAEYADIRSKAARLSSIREDQYYQALHVKFGYALTCHKSQGGQWKHVFIDLGNLRGIQPDREYLRWLYTAITRATEKVFLMNCPDELIRD